MLRKILRKIKNGALTSLAFVSRRYNKMYRGFFPSATIFLYHRIDDMQKENDPYKLCVSRQNFEEHIKYISKNFQVIRLPELLESLREKTLRKNTAVITFDDGYLDNLTNALPILEKYNVPVTIFVTAGLLGKNPWWEEKMKIMNEDELKSFAQNNLIEIGAHTMTHPHLSKQDYEEQEKELKESKKILEDIIKKPVENFAYPFGSRNDYNEDSIKTAKKYYKSACANFYGLVKAKTDIFQLPRVNIQNWPIEEFKRKI